MAPEAWGAAIGATLTGLTGLVVAVSGLRKVRNAQLREDLQACYAEQERLRARHLAALGHIGYLEEHLTNHRVAVPQRPPILAAGHISEPHSEWQPRHAAQ